MAARTLLCVVSVIALLIGGLSVGLTGCGGGGESVRTAQLRVAVTDAPAGFASLVVAIREIRVVQTGEENAPTGPGLPLIGTFDPPRSIDIISLAYQQELLGEAVVPAGTYQQVRLVLEPNEPGEEPVNYVTFEADPTTKHALTTPSGQESGLKVLGRFEVKAGELNAIVLDFDPDRAVVEAGASGQVLLKPTGIRIVQVADVLPTYGSLSGTVAPQEAWPSAVVSVVCEGSSSAIASGTVNPDDGTFRAFVPAGNYTVRVTADGFEPFDSAQTDPPGLFSVAQGADTPVGAITLVPTS